uniref:Uncharacterized protein n=1 Tax=Leptobrachium leishanense TaxID=445787 RepID=A0A8C5QM48_9ANUR
MALTCAISRSPPGFMKLYVFFLRFSFIISGSVPVKHTEIMKAEGESVTFQPDYSGPRTEVVWKIGEDKLVELEENYSHYYRLADRASASFHSGSLTIKDLYFYLDVTLCGVNKVFPVGLWCNVFSLCLPCSPPFSDPCGAVGILVSENGRFEPSGSNRKMADSDHPVRIGDSLKAKGQWVLGGRARSPIVF